MLLPTVCYALEPCITRSLWFPDCGLYPKHRTNRVHPEASSIPNWRGFPFSIYKELYHNLYVQVHTKCTFCPVHLS